MKRKKREFNSSELAKILAKIYGFEDKFLALDVQDFLNGYLDQAMFQEIESVNLKDKILIINIESAIVKNEFRMRKSFFLKKIQEQFGDEHISDLLIY